MNQPPTTTGNNATGRRRRFIDGYFTLSWVLNAALLVVAVVWIGTDGRSLGTLERFAQDVGLPGAREIIFGSSKTGATTTDVKVVAIVVACTLAAMLASLFLGDDRLRTLRGWLLFTAIAGGWLGLVVGWSDVYWIGQRGRIAAALPAIAEIAQQLSSNWPEEDGELPALGSYLAYPKPDPRMLLLLQQVTFPGTDLRFSAVERSADGAIRFELAGPETGAWVERRPDARPPQQFVGGLETSYQIARQQEIAPGWFLVRYHAKAGIDF